MGRNAKKVDSQLKRLHRAMDDKIPRRVAVETQQFFQDRFQEQGWRDQTLDPWKSRKHKEKGKNILVQSGALQDSIQILQERGGKVVIGTDLPYARIHNEGGVIEVPVTKRMRDFFWHKFHKTGELRWKHMALTKKEKFEIEIPQRQFIGDSDTLEDQIGAIIREELRKAFHVSKK